MPGRDFHCAHCSWAPVGNSLACCKAIPTPHVFEALASFLIGFAPPTKV